MARRRPRLPWLTYVIVASCTIAHAWQLELIELPSWLAHWLVPCSRAAIDQGMWHSTLSYAWLHMSLAHLLGNMGLLVCCASAFEGACGHVRTLVAYLAGAVTGALAFACVRPEMDPQLLIGASGAVFAMVGAYAVALIKAQGSAALGTAARRALRMRLAWVARLVCVNLFYGMFLTQGVSNMAHLGGLAAGATVAALTIWAPRHPRPPRHDAQAHAADPITWP